MLISRVSWESEGRWGKPLGFLTKGNLQLVDVIGEKPALVNRPYHKKLPFKVGDKRNPRSELIVNIKPFITEIYPIMPKPIYSSQSDSVRGKIMDFTRKSRLRMMRRVLSMSKMPSYFCTLTYDDTVIKDYSQDEMVKKIKKDINKLGVFAVGRFKGIGAIWRIEWVARKSGICAGWVVPHLHLLIYNVDGEREGLTVGLEIRKMWIKYTGTVNPAAVAVTNREKSWIKLDGRKHAIYYMSKYTAKEGDNMGFSTGRHWGQFGNVPKAEGVALRCKKKESDHLIRFLKKWFEAKGYNGESIIKNQVHKGRKTTIYMSEMEMIDFLELSAELGDTPF